MRKQMQSWKQHIARNFNKAAQSYEANSPAQKQAATHLAKMIAREMTLQSPSILELGCGTGHLTRALFESFETADWLISDIAPQMVSMCMERMPKGANLKYTVMDAEDLNRPERFALICSNRTAEGFTDGPGAFQKLISLLKPGGLLALSTLGPNTFKLCPYIFRASACEPVMPHYPSKTDLRSAFPDSGTLKIETKIFSAKYASAYDFARALKDMGAHAHSYGGKQLSPGTVRAVLRRFDEMHKGAPVQADYEVYFLLYRNLGHE